MNFFKRKTTWSNAELWLYKFCAACGGIIIGIFFYDFLSGHLFEFVAAFSATVIWVIYLWAKKMKQ